MGQSVARIFSQRLSEQDDALVDSFRRPPVEPGAALFVISICLHVVGRMFCESCTLRAGHSQPQLLCKITHDLVLKLKDRRKLLTGVGVPPKLMVVARVD